jgi:hypothetical protein
LQNNQPVYRNVELSHIDTKNYLEPIEIEQYKKSTIALSNIETSLTHYPEDSPHFPTIYKFLYRLMNIDAVRGVDYIEISDKIIISYYIYNDKSFLNYLLVTNRSCQILLNDLIAEAEGIGIDTFTVKSDTLLYVKNQTQFVGYKL